MEDAIVAAPASTPAPSHRLGASPHVVSDRPSRPAGASRLQQPGRPRGSVGRRGVEDRPGAHRPLPTATGPRGRNHSSVEEVGRQGGIDPFRALLTIRFELALELQHVRDRPDFRSADQAFVLVDLDGESLGCEGCVGRCWGGPDAISWAGAASGRHGGAMHTPCQAKTFIRWGDRGRPACPSFPACSCRGKQGRLRRSGRRWLGAPR